MSAIKCQNIDTYSPALDEFIKLKNITTIGQPSGIRIDDCIALTLGWTTLMDLWLLCI